jgi:hypothetical protein
LNPSFEEWLDMLRERRILKICSTVKFLSFAVAVCFAQAVFAQSLPVEKINANDLTLAQQNAVAELFNHSVMDFDTVNKELASAAGHVAVLTTTGKIVEGLTGNAPVGRVVKAGVAASGLTSTGNSEICGDLKTEAIGFFRQGDSTREFKYNKKCYENYPSVTRKVDEILAVAKRTYFDRKLENVSCNGSDISYQSKDAEATSQHRIQAKTNRDGKVESLTVEPLGDGLPKNIRLQFSIKDNKVASVNVLDGGGKPVQDFIKLSAFDPKDKDGMATSPPIVYPAKRTLEQYSTFVKNTKMVPSVTAQFIRDAGSALPYFLFNQGKINDECQKQQNSLTASNRGRNTPALTQTASAPKASK